MASSAPEYDPTMVEPPTPAATSVDIEAAIAIAASNTRDKAARRQLSDSAGSGTESDDSTGSRPRHHWTRSQTWIYTWLVVSMPAIISFSSSMPVPALSAIAGDFNSSRLLASLAVSSAYLVGFGLGPFVFAPMSEVLGRNPVYYTTFFLFTIVTMTCGFPKNVGTLGVLRLLAGFFGSPAVANSGGSLTDLWAPEDRSVPMALFTAASFCGPVLAPTVGGFVTQYAGWRWNFWIVAIVSAVLFVLIVLILPETYPTKRKNKKTGEYQEKPRPPRAVLFNDFKQGLVRPWLMFFREPILFCLSLYMAFIYGVLFLDFTAYPIIYQESRGWSLSIAGLSFLGIGLGMAIATAISPYLDNLRAKYVARLGPVPEARLPHLIPAAWFLPIGLFIFAWTAEPPVHFIVSILAGVPFGFGLVIVFLGINTYLADCYERYSSSALAANALLRCSFGAGFAIFAGAMYDNLGTPWATTLLGFIAVALTPLPWLFYRYGPLLRSKSKYHQMAIRLG